MTLSEIKSTYLIYCLHSAVSIPIDVTHKNTHEGEKEQQLNGQVLTITQYTSRHLSFIVIIITLIITFLTHNKKAFILFYLACVIIIPLNRKIKVACNNISACCKTSNSSATCHKERHTSPPCLPAERKTKAWQSTAVHLFCYATPHLALLPLSRLPVILSSLASCAVEESEREKEDLQLSVSAASGGLTMCFCLCEPSTRHSAGGHRGMIARREGWREWWVGVRLE